MANNDDDGPFQLRLNGVSRSNPFVCFFFLRFKQQKPVLHPQWYLPIELWTLSKKTHSRTESLSSQFGSSFHVNNNTSYEIRKEKGENHVLGRFCANISLKLRVGTSVWWRWYFTDQWRENNMYCLLVYYGVATIRMRTWNNSTSSLVKLWKFLL